MIDEVDDILDPGNENSEWIARGLIQNITWCPFE